MDGFDVNELFAENCFLPCIGEVEVKLQPVIQRKSLDTLVAELEVIKNNIEEIKAREWHLDKLLKFHKEGIAFH